MRMNAEETRIIVTRPIMISILYILGGYPEWVSRRNRSLTRGYYILSGVAEYPTRSISATIHSYRGSNYIGVGKQEPCFISAATHKKGDRKH
jgi:hypothetical protein